jgi:hypothetical protein
MKRCSKCEKAKSKAAFHRDKTKKDGLQSSCNTCRRECQQNSIKKTAEYKKQWDKDNIKKLQQYRKERHSKKADYDKIYNRNNAKKIAERKRRYKQERKKVDSVFKFTENVRILIIKSFKKAKGLKKQTKTEQLLGCSIAELRAHLAKQFKTGMSLENHGQWHIDHIVPLASAQTQQDIERLCHYTNLQPLWAIDNLKKGAK